MIGIKIPVAHAQEVKLYLMQHDLFDKHYSLQRTQDSILFPVTREFTPPFDFDYEFVTQDGKERPSAIGLKEAIWPLLSDEEKQDAIFAYDIVGTIAIIEVSDILIAKEKLIGEKLLEVNKTVTTVLKKIGGHEGVFRTQQMACIAGEDTRETIVIENGIKLKVNVETTYYSVRMATERKRIMEMIKPGENVLCLFSGVGPYPITFSRHTEANNIVGIEINPQAHELAVENAAKNRCANVRLMCGDAHDIIPKLAATGEKFDRFTMPLPHTADEFLDDLLTVCSDKAVIHFYCFLQEGAFNVHIQKIRDACERHKFKLASYDVVKAGQHAPRVWRLCVDARVER